jgi:hypothetical protein
MVSHANSVFVLLAVMVHLLVTAIVPNVGLLVYAPEK